MTDDKPTCFGCKLRDIAVAEAREDAAFAALGCKIGWGFAIVFAVLWLAGPAFA